MDSLPENDHADCFAGDDQIAEAEAACNGPPCSENPSDWPEFTDADRWELGPEPTTDGVTLALRQIGMIAVYTGHDGPVDCQEELECAAAELQRAIDRACNDPPGPSEEDLRWLTANPILPAIGAIPQVPDEPCDRDWDEMARWSEEVFGPPRGGPITDEDVIVATGSAG
jgi:hypothetical protein